MASMVSLLRTQQVVLARIQDVLNPLGLNVSQNQVLQILAMSPTGAQKLSPISVQLLVHRTRITVVVDQLEKAGLVVRKAHPTDRRAVLAELTPAGRAVAEEANRLMIETNFGMPEGVSERDLDHLTALLKSIREEV